MNNGRNDQKTTGLSQNRVTICGKTKRSGKSITSHTGRRCSPNDVNFLIRKGPGEKEADGYGDYVIVSARAPSRQGNQIGWVWIGRKDSTFKISDFQTAHMWRKMGIGRKMMEMAISYACSMGASLIWLSPKAEGDKGLNQQELVEFYKRLGFDWDHRNNSGRMHLKPQNIPVPERGQAQKFTPIQVMSDRSKIP